MNKTLKNILEKYSDNESLLERLLVTLFIKSNAISLKRNRLIQSYILTTDDKHFDLINSLHITFGFDELIEAFELIIPASDKVANGAVYTPDYIKKYIVQKGFDTYTGDTRQVKICDISCGCGGFLVSAAEKIKALTGESYSKIFKDNIYGLDISIYSVNRAKIILSLLAIINGEDRPAYDFNLFIGNALDFDWKQKCEAIRANRGFDLIVGNPPYVRAKNIDQRDKKLLINWSVTKSGNPDLYIPFFEIGLHNLKEGGALGYITVNSFYKSVNARSLREYFQRNALDLAIIDFGNEKVFENKSAYTCICLINNSRSEAVKFVKSNSMTIRENRAVRYTKIPYNTLDSQRGWLLSDSTIIKNIKKIESCGKPLGELFNIKNGIATLSNETYIFKPVSETEKYYVLVQSGKEFKIEKEVCKDIIKPNILKDESQIADLKEKLIYPYTNGIGPLTLMNETTFKSRFPYAYKYLEANKPLLLKRDKGHGDYGAWYAYGRSQALTNKGYKLLFPYMAKEPHFVYTDQKDLFIYCGYAIFSESPTELLVLKKLLNSSVFSYYITNTSKPYSAGFYSFAKNYVKNFGVCFLSSEEKEWLLATNDKSKIDKFFGIKYSLEEITSRHESIQSTNSKSLHASIKPLKKAVKLAPQLIN